MRIIATALALALATTAYAGEDKKAEPIKVCEADNARLRALLDELARVLAKLSVAASDAGAPRAGN